MRVWTAALVAAMCVAAAAVPAAQRRGAAATTQASCTAPLGTGVKSHRMFCDVLIGTKPDESIAVTIPAHTGTATLQFDLHNRFTVPAVATISGPLVFQRHEAVVAVIRTDGRVIGRAAAVHEFRRLADLFDQIDGGARPGGVKSVAPGPADAVRITIPAGVTSFGIVGSRLHVLRRASEETFDAPGRPVAIVSNIRVEYRH
jgi:hypothetical protein